jgi:DNA invertase Pin-like site-specific DNA recombinase
MTDGTRRRSHVTENWVIAREDGCSYHDHCLTCPFSVCRLDVPANGLAKERRVQTIRTLLAAGLSVEEMMAAAGWSRRTVKRALKDAGDAKESTNR